MKKLEINTTSAWPGGTTSQLAILPSDREYSGRDFDFRISIATIECSTSQFTSLPDYNRILLPISVGMTLVNGGDSIKLKQFEEYRFSGGDDVRSCGCGVDFGIMCRKGVCDATVRVVTLQGGESVQGGGDSYIYTLSGDVAVSGTAATALGNCTAIVVDYVRQPGF